jgi:hypothetical protein
VRQQVAENSCWRGVEAESVLQAWAPVVTARTFCEMDQPEGLTDGTDPLDMLDLR